MQKIFVKAYGKINLSLDVLKKREDGYHELAMVMQTVGVYDGIEIKRTKGKGITIKCNVKNVPTDESNLVYKAAKLLIDEFNIIDGLSINIEKVIPAAKSMLKEIIRVQIDKDFKNGEDYVLKNFIWTDEMEQIAQKMKEIDKNLNGRVEAKLAKVLLES